MKVAALQMVSTPDLQANLQVARALLQQASAAGAELAALSEYFCAMGLRATDKLGLRETFGQGPGLALAQIDRQQLARVRAQLPALQHCIL